MAREEEGDRRGARTRNTANANTDEMDSDRKEGGERHRGRQRHLSYHCNGAPPFIAAAVVRGWIIKPIGIKDHSLVFFFCCGFLLSKVVVISILLRNVGYQGEWAREDGEGRRKALGVWAGAGDPPSASSSCSLTHETRV